MATTENAFKIDWSVLRFAIAISIISVMMAIAALWLSFDYQQQKQFQLVKRTRFLNDTKNQQTELDQTSVIIDQHYDQQFARLQAQNFFRIDQADSVEEQRLTMEEQINKLLPPDKLPTGTYQLQERQIYKIPAINTESDFKVYKTKINLQLSLLHEGDVLKLLQEMEAQPHLGLLNLEYCYIKQLHSINIRDVSQPNFTANCNLGWYTAEIDQEAEVID